MLSYCLKCKKRKNTENINLAVLKTSNGKIMMLSRCDNVAVKNSDFIKEQEASGILSSLGLETPLSEIPLLGDIFFECNSIEWNSFDIIKKHLLVGDTFMPEMHLEQPQFTYSTCGPFTKSKERIQNI